MGEDMDDIINNECVATFGYGARGANYEELTGEVEVTGMPETNVCGGWLIGTSNPDGDTDHHGVVYNDCVSGNSRNCWGSGSNMRNTVPNNTCRNSPRKSMCVKPLKTFEYVGCVTWQQECREQSHEQMDQIMNDECVATFGPGARAATYEELTGEVSVTG